MNTTDLLSATDIARMHGVTTQTVCHAIHQGYIDARRFGWAWVVDEESAARYFGRPARRFKAPAPK